MVTARRALGGVLTVLLTTAGLSSMSAASSVRATQTAKTATSKCQSAPTDKGLLLVSPSGGALPIRASANFQVSGLAPALKPGEEVTFRIICGPDAPASGTSYVAVHPASSTPDVPMAYLPFANNGQAGTDTVVITTKVNGDTLTDVIHLQWTQPVQCWGRDASLGYALALECKVQRLQPLLHTALNMVSCGLGIASLIAPLAKLPDLFRLASEGASTEDIKRAAGVKTPVAAFVEDLQHFSAESNITWRELAHDFIDASSIGGFLQTLVNIYQVLPTGQVKELGIDLVGIAGLGGCLTLLQSLVRFIKHEYQVSLNTLCSNSAVTNDSVNGCPYDGSAVIGNNNFNFQGFVDNNDDSVKPAYWDLIDFPGGTCTSVDATFGIPDNNGSTDDVAFVKIVQGNKSTEASARHGSTATVHALLDGQAWAVWNSATNADDEIAINLTAACSTSSGF